ncbi:MAG: T9SS type A sorting domain-containing protein [Bacteroidia bacterium]
MQNGLFVLDASAIISTNNISENNTEIKIWPVPAGNETLHISLQNNYKGKINYNIYDLSGRIIISGEINKTISNHNLEIAIDKLAAGSYMIEFSGNDFVTAKKFVK